MAGSRAVFFLALRDLRRDRKIFIMVVFLLTFSYINLTFFPAFLNGLSDAFQSEVVDTGTGHLLIRPSFGNTYLSNVHNLQQKIELIPGVVGSSGHVSTTATVKSKDIAMGVQATGLDPSQDRLVTSISTKVVKGEWLSDNDRGKVVVGQLIAGGLHEDKIGETSQFGTLTEGLGGVQPGDTVTLTFSNGVTKNFHVKGIANSEGFGFVSQSAYITMADMDEIFGLDDQADSLLVRLNDPENADHVKTLVLGLGLKQADILTWKEASNFAAGLNATFGIVNVVTTIVAVVIVMATVSIVVFINTARKKRIIGVLKAIGMRESLVLRIFLVEALIFGIIGSVLGIGLMLLTLSYFQGNPLVLPIGSLRPSIGLDILIGSAGLIVLISVIAGYFPSRMASRAETIESLKAVE